jgi:hypothetical protein
MIAPRQIAELRWRPQSSVSSAHRPFPAASGIVLVGEMIAVCADDELDLALFRSIDGEFVRCVNLLPGELPESEKPRKKSKPDFEVLVSVPPSPGSSNAQTQLFAVGSGSRETRDRAVLVNLDATTGSPLGPSELFVLKPLYDRFRAARGTLNIEGLLIWDLRTLCFVHRSTSLAQGPSCLFVVRLTADFPLGLSPSHIKSATIHAVISLALPVLDGIPAGPTDALALPGGDVLLSWAAEHTEDPVLDGEVVGSGLALLPRAVLDGFCDGAVAPCTDLVRLKLPQSHKVEGIALVGAGGRSLLMVTDPDARSSSSLLLSLPWPLNRC